MKRFFVVAQAVLLTVAFNVFSQTLEDRNAVTFEPVYDEPYAVNKLFIGFQPLYGELFVANTNAGFGLEAQYYLQDKADFKASFRKTYSSSFFDLNRSLANDNSLQDNRSQVFNYFELGGTWHVRDFEESSSTKMVLYRKSYRGNRWASRMPVSTSVPAKVRKIYGVRAGGFSWAATTDLSGALEAQGLSNADLKDAEGNSLPPTVGEGNREEPLNLYTNISAANVYLGGSMAWMRNVAVDFDTYEQGVDDLMLTVFFDLIYAPSINIDDVSFTHSDPNAPITGRRTYDVSPISLKSFGARAGIEGKFNRTFSWAYGAEIGYRPGIEGRTFFALVKVSFPMFGSTLDYKVESFQK